MALGIVIGLLLGLGAGVAGGYVLRHRQGLARIGSAEARARSLIGEAEREADTKKREIVVRAQDEALRLRQDLEEELKTRRTDVDGRENRAQQREEQLEKRDRGLDDRDAELGRVVKQLEEKALEMQAARERVE